MDRNQLAEAAVHYGKVGIHILPCDPADKKPCGELVPKDLGPNGKPVKGSGGLKKASCDSVTILDWWQLRPDAMIGVRTGEVSGFFVVDQDRPKQVKNAPIGTMSPDGIAAWRKLVDEHGGHAPTIEVTSPSGGVHTWFRYDPSRRVTNSEGRLSGLGINIRGDGGYVIGPPSARSDGGAYVANRSFDRDAIAPAPEWLYELISPRRSTDEGGQETSADTGPGGSFPPTDDNRRRLLSALAVVPSDDRDIWLRIGAALNTLEPEWGVEAQDIWDAWSSSSAKFDPDDQELTWSGFDPARPDGATVGTIFFEAKQRGWPRPFSAVMGPGDAQPSAKVIEMKDYSDRKDNTSDRKDNSSQDAGNTSGSGFYTVLSPRNSEDDLALAFTARHHVNLRYVAAWGKWLEWTGAHWKPEDTLKVFDLSRGVCRAAAMMPDTMPGEAKRITKSATVAAIEHLSRADRRIAATKDQWDSDEDVFNPGKEQP
jgi:hypothetical protein